MISHQLNIILGENARGFVVEKSFGFGDYATNAAMMNAKKGEGEPRDFAEFLMAELWKSEEIRKVVEKMEIAGPGFINFYLKDDVVRGNIGHILNEGTKYGKNETEKGQKVIVEYTDPNPFKEVHIGHLMSNTIGEAFSRIIEANGADVKRACYQGDVGMHVAKSIYGMQRMEITDVHSLGKAYVFGSQAYEAVSYTHLTLPTIYSV